MRTLRAQRQKLIAARHGQKGMTLLEIMIVIAIIGLVAAAAVGLLMNQLEQGKIKTTEIKMNEIKKAIDIYKATNKKLPNKLTDLTNPQKGKATLKDIDDDFGKEIKYERGNKKGFTLISAGPDGDFGGDDDITVTGP